MNKTSESRLETYRRYDAKRAGRQVGVRLSEDEIKALDVARGEESRSAYLLRIVRKALKGK